MVYKNDSHVDLLELPSFVILQKEIRQEISKAIKIKELGPTESELMSLIDGINERDPEI